VEVSETLMGVGLKCKLRSFKSHCKLRQFSHGPLENCWKSVALRTSCPWV